MRHSYRIKYNSHLNSWQIFFIFVMIGVSSCDMSNKTFYETSDSDRVCSRHQDPIDYSLEAGTVIISGLNISDNIKYGNEEGICVKFDCVAGGYKGDPLYFYAKVWYGDDLSPVLDAKNKQVAGFDMATCIYDNVKISGIGLFIPYSNLPSRYHGNLIIQLVVLDGYDNIIYADKGVSIFYSTL